MLGIIGAMEVEVEKLRAKMTETEMKTVAGMNFCRGKLEGKDVVIVRSGIGKVNAGICSQILVDLYQVDGIVNTGIAGSLRNEINIGDLVLSTVAVQHDVDAGGFGYPAGEIVCDQFLPSFGNVVVAGEELTKNDPETVDGFCRALNKAIEYIIDGHTEEAVDMSIEKYAPTFAEKRDVVVEILNDVFIQTLWQSDYTNANGIGASNPEKWQALIESSKEMGNIDEVFETSELLYSPAK